MGAFKELNVKRASEKELLSVWIRIHDCPEDNLELINNVQKELLGRGYLQWAGNQRDKTFPQWKRPDGVWIRKGI